MVFVESFNVYLFHVLLVLSNSSNSSGWKKMSWFWKKKLEGVAHQNFSVKSVLDVTFDMLVEKLTEK